jgi:hypothetical protein
MNSGGQLHLLALEAGETAYDTHWTVEWVDCVYDAVSVGKMSCLASVGN